MSLVVSRADERVIVLRNGIEIGRAKVSITDRQQPFGTHAFVTQAADAPTGAVAGTTLVMTDVPILPRTTGAAMTVVTNQRPETWRPEGAAGIGAARSRSTSGSARGRRIVPRAHG